MVSPGLIESGTYKEGGRGEKDWLNGVIDEQTTTGKIKALSDKRGKEEEEGSFIFFPHFSLSRSLDINKGSVCLPSNSHVYRTFVCLFNQVRSTTGRRNGDNKGSTSSLV